MTGSNSISATVDIILGDIRFVASDRADTVVEVRPVDPSRELDVKAAKQANIEFADGKLLVKHPKLRTAFTTKFGSVVLVELPTGSDVEGDTAKGEYFVDGGGRLVPPEDPHWGPPRVEEASGVRLRTTGGKVIVDHVTGQADVSGNGDIRIRQIDGGAVVKNIGGDSWAGEVAGDLRANSVNGGITVDVARAAVDLYTATGELEVGVPQGTAAWLDARSSTGRVHNYPEAPDAPEQSDWTVKVRVRSHGGDIIVHRACPRRGTDRAHLASPGSRDGQRLRLSPPMPSPPLP
jgi:hypothetical protein